MCSTSSCLTGRCNFCFILSPARWRCCSFVVVSFSLFSVSTILSFIYFISFVVSSLLSLSSLPCGHFALLWDTSILRPDCLVACWLCYFATVLVVVISQFCLSRFGRFCSLFSLLWDFSPDNSRDTPGYHLHVRRSQMCAERESLPPTAKITLLRCLKNNVSLLQAAFLIVPRFPLLIIVYFVPYLYSFIG